MDLSKAFDIISLLAKLKTYGMTNESVKILSRLFNK
jgi:hypothetical protein